MTQDIEKIKINKDESENVQHGISNTVITNQPTNKEIPKEEKKEPVPSKPKSGLAMIMEKKDKERAEAEKKNPKKDVKKLQDKK